MSKMQLQGKSAGLAEPHSNSVLSTFISALSTACVLAGSIIGIGTIWYGGCYFGQPLGRIVTETLTPGKDELNVQRYLGGFFAIIMCAVALFREDIATKEKGFGDVKVSWQQSVLFWIKVIGGGLGAVAILGWIVRLWGLS